MQTVRTLYRRGIFLGWILFAVGISFGMNYAFFLKQHKNFLDLSVLIAVILQLFMTFIEFKQALGKKRE